MTEPKLEPLRWWHISALIPIEVDLFGPEQWSPGMFWNELAQGHYYRVASENEEIVGYAGLAMNGPDEAWVQNIAVRRDRQGRGLGATLLADLLAEAARRAARQTLLEVAADNTAAQKLYARYDFEPIGLRRGYYQPSGTDALVMRRDM